MERYLNEVPVKKGDCYLIKSGMIHAICEGVIIAEIQQSSDLTYRVYDYGRPRELHREKALDVIDFRLKGENLGIDESEMPYNCWINLCKNEYFSIDKAMIDGIIENKSDINRCSILTCVAGQGVIVTENSRENIGAGDSFLIPAMLGKYEINGNLTILKSQPMPN